MRFGRLERDRFHPAQARRDGAHEFEHDDIDRAPAASEVVKEYCADAISEAQRLGCES